MESNAEGNLLEIMDLARTLRQEQLFIQQEQATFAQLTEALADNSASITRLAYICAQQRRNLNDLIISRPELGPSICCRRANNFENSKFVDAKKVLDYEHAIAYEELFNFLYRSPYLLAISLATGDKSNDISSQHINAVIHTISTSLFGNAINTKDVEMILKLLRELIEIQIVTSDDPRRLLRANTSAFARLYHRLNESMFSAKIFLTAALYQPIMSVLSETDIILDLDPQMVIQSFSSKERIKRFGPEDAAEYRENIEKFHSETINILHKLAEIFIDNLLYNWSLFPSTLRWLVQTMCHQLKQSHNFSDKMINEIITDMVFSYFICPAIVNPDAIGLIDAPISEQVRFNLMQIGQIIQMMALNKHSDADDDGGGVMDAKFREVYKKFESNNVTKLIDLLLVTHTGEDVVAILAQQSDFERSHLLTTRSEMAYFTEFFRILTASDDYEITEDEKAKLKKILKSLPEQSNGSLEQAAGSANDNGSSKEKSKQSLINLSKATKSKLAKSMSFSHSNGGGGSENCNGLLNGSVANQNLNASHTNGLDAGNSSHHNSLHSSPVRSLVNDAAMLETEQVLIFNLYTGVEQKLQPLSEEEVLKMNSIGQELPNGSHGMLDNDTYQQESTVDKSSVVNGFDGMSDVLRPLHNKNARFSLSHDDASIGNSDNLEAVSEVPSNHSVTSSLELEENAENDNLSDMVSANVSGRGTPNISGRDTPSSQVTDGESVANALPTPQMQKLISKVRSDIEDKFCKFEIKKFEVDETVSIISDTWSTDVLASDSETVDAADRERERNFSTPLIPATVVLPGDNNFGDALAGTAGSVIRTGFLDASDQRSESNWSTDVLASDSEKFNEVDTDDNVSITARSDTLDSSLRSDFERNQLAAAISAVPRRAANSAHNHHHHYNAARNNNRNFRAPTNSTGGSGGVGSVSNAGTARDSSVHKVSVTKAPAVCATGNNDEVNNVSGASSGGNASDHSQEDSAFFDAINSYDDNSGNASAHNSANHRRYLGGSSLARSSVRTTHQMGGENSFQQNYKFNSYNDDDKANYLPPTNRMRRQASADSSISNKSINEELGGGVVAREKMPSSSSCGTARKQRHQSNASNDSKDLIDFSDFCNNTDLTPPSAAPPQLPQPSLALLDMFSSDLVEHRRTTMEQRTVGDDGRRNGILALKGGRENGGSGQHSTPSLRRHQSLNYENHEIVLNSVPKRISAFANLSPQTDDDKRQQLQQQEEAELSLLTNNTSALKLSDESSSPNDTFDNIEASRNTPTNVVASTTGIMLTTSSLTTQQQLQKPTKSTGAIPKSISFDASADKTPATSGGLANISAASRLNRSPHFPVNGSSVSATAHNNFSSNSGIFNKLKQGIFKTRRGHKSRHHSTNTNCEDISQSSRSVSFSTNNSEVSLDLLSANLPGCSTAATATSSTAQDRGYYDISEDILAKYRRKVSTSSEATNSSTGNNTREGAIGGCGLNGIKEPEQSDIHATNIVHDRAMAFNIIKRKIRTVLSKTDLHSNDFRHTTHTNASPLLTYLQIQLGQALNLQNFQQISYVSEAIRCVFTLDESQQLKLLDELQQDIQKRQSYLQYLMRFRQNLLMTMENIDQYEARLRSESLTCNRYLMAVCMRLFFEKRQDKLETFQQDFAHLTVSDDKIDLIEEFIDGLIEELLTPGGFLYGMPEWQPCEARMALERILLDRMYQQVMFPNEDADLSRDTVLLEHIRKLQNVITPSHPSLCISQVYLSEAPWSFAQQELKFISAYRTPREKLQCVIRCISSIMSLLHMSSGRVPAADDILPVLIYVVIMANPPYLLSTVEYITCFIGEKLNGEEQFYWTLFGSVVKFIKTMDYADQ